jgi:hypothetical protein
MNDLERYVVVPRSGTSGNELLELLSLVAERPDVSVERIVGDRYNPRFLVIRAMPDAIRGLQSQFGGQLIIEPDSGLHPLS